MGICAQEAGMNMRRLRHSALKTEKRSLKVHLHQVRIALTKLPKVIWTDRIAGMADFFMKEIQNATPASREYFAVGGSSRAAMRNK